MADTGPTRRGVTATQVSVWSSLVWLSALALVLGFTHHPWRSGLVVGLVCALVSGTAGLVATVKTEGGKLNDALLGRAIAFGIRLMLLAGGLVLTIRVLHAEPLAFVLAFFPFFFASSVLEQLVAGSASASKAPGASDAAGGAR